jgi:hypothetical protein
MAAWTGQITADMVFPNELAIPIVDGVPQFPEKLEPKSRIPTQTRDVGGATVYIRPG